MRIALDGGVPSLVSDRLEPGEHLLWWDRPPAGLIFRPADWFLVPFSVLWACFAFFWEAKVLDSNAPPLFGLVGVPFVLVGIYILVGRFVHDAWRRGRTAYGLTDQRVMIVTGSWETKSVYLEGLGEVNLRERGDGTGSIIFGHEQSPFMRGNLGAWSGRPSVPTFERVKDVRRVLSAIREAQKAVRQKD